MQTVPVFATQPIPEPSRQLHITDLAWMTAFYPHLPQQPDWWLEVRLLEDRSDGVKGPIAAKFFQDFEEMAEYLNIHRDVAQHRARQRRESGVGPWPTGLFWGVQPRLTRRGCKQHVAAFVTLACDLDCKDWTELSPEDRPQAVWTQLHSAAPSPSVVTWTGHGFHGYWLLNEPLQDKQRGEEVQKAIARCLRGDNVADCSRLLRWPNSVNYKGLMDNQCRRVRVVWWQPEQRYAFDALTEHFLPLAQASKPADPGNSPGGRLAWQRFFRCMDRDSALQALWKGLPSGLSTDDRSALDMALAHSLVRHKFPQDAFATIAPQAPWNVQKTLTSSYLERTWDKTQRPGLRVIASVPSQTAPDREAYARPTLGPRPAAVPASPTPTTPPAPPALTPVQDMFLDKLPEAAWTDWARLYRDAVGPSTEAADEFHYLALLTILGTALGRSVTVSCGRPVHANIYAMLVGPTGDRKSTAAQLALELLRQVAPEVLMLNGVGSQEGLMERMAEAEVGNALHSRTLLFVDEMAALLKKGRRESSGSLLEFITELFHGPEFKTHATRTKAIHLNCPTLSILAASTPAWLEAALEEEDVLGGFTNRFVYVAAPVKPDNPLPDLPDATKLRSLVEWMRQAMQGPARVMSWAPGVKAQWFDFYLQWRRFTATQDERVVALLRRIDLYILKFASISAAMDDTTEINATHLAAAIDLGRYVAGCSYRILGDLGDPKDCRLERLIEQKLRVQGGMSRKHLRQVLGGRVTGEKLDRVLRAMERNGLIRQVEQLTVRGPTRLVELTAFD